MPSYLDNAHQHPEKIWAPMQCQDRQFLPFGKSLSSETALAAIRTIVDQEISAQVARAIGLNTLLRSRVMLPMCLVGCKLET